MSLSKIISRVNRRRYRKLSESTEMVERNDPEQIDKVSDMEKLVGPITFEYQGGENLYFKDGRGKVWYFKYDGREAEAKKIRRYFGSPSQKESTELDEGWKQVTLSMGDLVDLNTKAKSGEGSAKITPALYQQLVKKYFKGQGTVTSEDEAIQSQRIQIHGKNRSLTITPAGDYYMVKPSTGKAQYFQESTELMERVGPKSEKLFNTLTKHLNSVKIRLKELKGVSDDIEDMMGDLYSSLDLGESTVQEAARPLPGPDFSEVRKRGRLIGFGKFKGPNTVDDYYELDGVLWYLYNRGMSNQGSIETLDKKNLQIWDPKDYNPKKMDWMLGKKPIVGKVLE